ncbi:MAG: DNA polymerase III subunit gamma/tau [Bacteroidales bacterium]|nr:DNA polymerase III subunit gamma/tau [Bacteroidales bacterium]
MSNFLVSARKYRPANFDTVVGQHSVTNTLKSAIKTGKIAHAYLFCGPRGVGKTTCARIFAKTLNCFNLAPSTEACDQCESCKSFNDSRSFNIHELDAASNNSVDDIRSLIDKVRILPQVGKYSIYIIDEVHMLSQAAFNAFLKTLEEPPEHAIFVLATTEKHKIIPTILSRCQIFDFQRIRIEDIVGYLAKVAKLEQVSYEEEALNVIALKADGAMRDALSIFDQVVSFSGGNVTYQEVLDNLNVLDYEYYFRMTEAFLGQDTAQVLSTFNEILQRGFDGQNFLSGLSSHFRDLLVCHDPSTLVLLEVTDVLKTRYRQQALLCPADFLFAALEICSQCELSFKASRNQRLHVELALIRLCNISPEKKKLLSEQDVLEVPEISQKPNNPAKPAAQPAVAVTAPAEPKNSRVHTPPPVTSESDNSYKAVRSISIKDALNGVSGKVTADDQTDTVSDAPEPESYEMEEAKPLTPEFLDQCWNAYIAQIREERPRMAVSLRNAKPRIEEGYRITVELNNLSQLDDFKNNTQHDLEKFLRRETCNIQIHIVAEMTEAKESASVKLYTSEEKFRYLSQKNPALANFKQKLNLELE